MNRVWLMAPLLALLLSCAVGCATGGAATVAPERPPDPREEVRPPKPGADVFWQSGHYAYDQESGYYWVAGRWAQPRRGWIWLPGYWEAVDAKDGARTWRWHAPRWEREGE